MTWRRFIRPAVLVLALVVILIVVRAAGLTDYLSLDDLARLRGYVESFGPAAYTFAGGSVTSGDLTHTFIYFGVAAAFFVILSLIPG